MTPQPKPRNGVRRAVAIAGAGAAVLAAIVAMAGAVWSASADRAATAAQATANRAAIVDQELRLRAVERQLGQVAADVRWIRATMEQGKRP
ncbi:MAG TPA: hypothetical protein VMY35_17370 [Phycisphaerae bacterium]|nr:hypothetical protein [Thermoguttaceae bacterium]HUX02735.1 hypothetical protein [Phycisphaerae bacterium]